MDQPDSGNGRGRKRTRKGESSGRIAYTVLRDRILERVFLPGDPLVEARLATELGMSRTPVRDALRMLEQDGLVVSIPNKGTFVDSLSPVEVAEIFDLREVVEGLAARLLCRRITRSQAETLEELAARADDPSATVTDDVEFHSAILRMCGSPRLNEVAGSFRLQALTYDERTQRVASNNGVPVIGNGRVADAHRSIALLIASGKQAEAEDAVRRHVRFGKNVVAKYLLGIEEFCEEGHDERVEKRVHPN